MNDLKITEHSSLELLRALPKARLRIHLCPHLFPFLDCETLAGQVQRLNRRWGIEVLDPGVVRRIAESSDDLNDLPFEDVVVSEHVDEESLIKIQRSERNKRLNCYLKIQETANKQALEKLNIKNKKIKDRRLRR